MDPTPPRTPAILAAEPYLLLLWDPHNAYVSVLGQFGVVGFALAAPPAEVG